MNDEMVAILNELIALIDPKIGNCSVYLSDRSNKSKDSSDGTKYNSNNNSNVSLSKPFSLAIK